MTTRAEYRSKFGDITGNGYVSIWLKNVRVGLKTPNKKTYQMKTLALLWDFLSFFLVKNVECTSASNCLPSIVCSVPIPSFLPKWNFMWDSLYTYGSGPKENVTDCGSVTKKVTSLPRLVKFPETWNTNSPIDLMYVQKALRKLS